MVAALPSEITIKEGDDLKLSASISHVVASEVMWYCDDEEVEEEDGIFFKTEVNNHINNLL